MRSLDIDQLKTFLSIVATGGFSRAAEQVHKTQAAVSVQMKRLEETVGCRLINRDSRSCSLTKDGEKFRVYASKIIQLNNEALGTLGSRQSVECVRIGIPLYLKHFYPLLFDCLARSHPGVEIDIVSLPSRDMLQATRSGTLDFALLTYRSAGQVGEVLHQEPLEWVAAKPPKALLDDVVPLAVYHATSSLRSAATEALTAVGRPYRIAYSSPSSDALMAAVANGLAITVLPRCAISPKLSILDAQQGLPDLPNCEISLVASKTVSGSLAAAIQGQVQKCLETHLGEQAKKAQHVDEVRLAGAHPKSNGQRSGQFQSFH